MFLSRTHNAVVYPGVNAAQIQAQIVNAMTLAPDVSALPFDMPTMQLARFIGLPALSRIEIDYTWPGQFQPQAHQKAMAAFMTLHPKCLNLSAMRTGKTMACVWAADYLMSLGLVRKALVICTLSNMQRVWDKEIYRHMLGRRKAEILYGDHKQRLAKLSGGDADFYIINHDGICVGSKRTPRGIVLGDLAQSLIEREDIDLVIVDEATAFKASGTRRWKVLKRIVSGKPYTWLLTGTPAPNAPTDAWALKRLIDNNVESFMGFRDRAMLRINQFKWVAKREAPDIVARFLQPAIRFSREDCIDIPPITIEQRECELSPAQKKAYQEMKHTLSVNLANGAQVNAVNEAVLRTKLIQISLGAMYGEDREIHPVDCKPRLDLLADILEEADSKVIVFAPLTSVVHLLYREVRKMGFSVEMVTGAVTSAKRTQIFQAFEAAPDPHVIVADPGTVAHGLDLTTASCIVWFGPTDKLEVYQQANARIDGPNQKRKMVAIQIASTPVEREIYKRLDEKRTLQGAILDMVRN